jgi:hypothetical protein
MPGSVFIDQTAEGIIRPKLAFGILLLDEQFDHHQGNRLIPGHVAANHHGVAHHLLANLLGRCGLVVQTVVHDQGAITV